VIVKVEIAGMQEGNFSVSYQDRSLVIRGVRPDDLLARRAYLQMEIPFGEFRTEIDLPFEVESREIEADYRDGFLRVILPKPPSDQSETGAS
jgi:HSP20 family protein